MIRVFQQYVSIRALLLVLVEPIVIATGITLAAVWRYRASPAYFENPMESGLFKVQVVAVVAIIQLAFYYHHLYGRGLATSWPRRVVDLGQSFGVACLGLGLLSVLLPGASLDQGIFLIGLLLAAIVVGVLRLASDWPGAATQQNYLILGTGPVAAELSQELAARRDLQVNLVGFLRLDSDDASDRFQNTLGGGDQLREIVMRHRIQRIVIAAEDRRGTLPMNELVRLRVEGVMVEDAHAILSALGGRVSLKSVQPSWFLFSEGFRRSRLALAAKASLDLVLSAAGLTLAFPIMLLVALAVRLESPGAILYRQTRVGARGKEFELLKFRSMRPDAESEGAQWAALNDPRVTRVGKWIRKSHLDELPQLFNVLRGEMSFVGPRPERPEFVALLRSQIPYYDERHTVRPGITGWAQVRYDYGSSVEDARHKLEYDLFYLKSMSFFFDLAIVLETVRIVATGRGAR